MTATVQNPNPQAMAILDLAMMPGSDLMALKKAIDEHIAARAAAVQEILRKGDS